jgi:hypothetical protein
MIENGRNVKWAFVWIHPNWHTPFFTSSHSSVLLRVTLSGWIEFWARHSKAFFGSTAIVVNSICSGRGKGVRDRYPFLDLDMDMKIGSLNTDESHSFFQQWHREWKEEEGKINESFILSASLSAGLVDSVATSLFPFHRDRDREGVTVRIRHNTYTLHAYEIGRGPWGFYILWMGRTRRVLSLVHNFPRYMWELEHQGSIL